MALSDGAIIAMARDANPEHDLTAMLPFLSRFAALVAEKEREACALICEKTWVEPGDAQVENCHEAAASIRARGKP